MTSPAIAVPGSDAAATVTYERAVTHTLQKVYTTARTHTHTHAGARKHACLIELE